MIKSHMFDKVNSNPDNQFLLSVMLDSDWFDKSCPPLGESYSFGKLQIQSMIWTSTLPLYAINSDGVSLFADSSFMFLMKLNMWLYLMYLSNWMNIILIVSNKKYKRFLMISVLWICPVEIKLWFLLYICTLKYLY
jgi:hypothetical protein